MMMQTKTVAEVKTLVKSALEAKPDESYSVGELQRAISGAAGTVSRKSVEAGCLALVDENMVNVAWTTYMRNGALRRGRAFSSRREMLTATVTCIECQQQVPASECERHPIVEEVRSATGTHAPKKLYSYCAACVAKERASIERVHQAGLDSQKRRAEARKAVVAADPFAGLE